MKPQASDQRLSVIVLPEYDGAMEDKELKKKLKKVPDVDKDGEPIWKIEESADRIEKKNRSKVPLFLKDKKTGAVQGNQQDEKDETPE